MSTVKSCWPDPKFLTFFLTLNRSFLLEKYFDIQIFQLTSILFQVLQTLGKWILFGGLIWEIEVVYKQVNYKE